MVQRFQRTSLRRPHPPRAGQKTRFLPAALQPDIGDGFEDDQRFAQAPGRRCADLEWSWIQGFLGPCSNLARCRLKRQTHGLTQTEQAWVHRAAQCTRRIHPMQRGRGVPVKNNPSSARRRRTLHAQSAKTTLFADGKEPGLRAASAAPMNSIELNLDVHASRKLELH
jgi:hypothetical protein